MKLNKRLILVVIPITLISFFGAALLAYKSLKASTIDLEERKLEARLTELETSFNQYKTYAESYLFASISAKKMQRFIQDDNNYRELSLRSGFKQTLSKFNYRNSSFISFSITEPIELGSNVILDVTRSEDPFAERYNGLQAINEQLFSSGEVIRRDYIETESGRLLLVISKLINAHTLEPPLPARTNNSYAIQFAIQLNDFEMLLENLVADYPTTVRFSELPESALALPAYGTRLFYEQEKDHSKFIEVAIAERFYEDKVAFIRFYFLVFGALFTLTYIVLTITLIKRYITSPILDLENNIEKVSQGAIDHIKHDEDAQDEINSLATSFSKLYGQLHRSYKRVREMNDVDALTGLYNLACITRISDEVLKEAENQGQHLAFFYIDLDNFKFVNDQYGHSTGDELLKAFTGRLLAKFRSAERNTEEIIAARIGGDEFCVIYQGNTSREALDGIARRILAIFDNGFSFDSGQLPVTASIGIAMYPDDGQTVSELLSAADTAMYAAKSSGKNQYAYYNRDLWVAMNRRLEIENCLKECTPDNEFELVYMPLISLSERTLSGFEVLVRWRSPKLGFVSPAEFVPIAESCGLFIKIDEWVIENAFKQYDQLSQMVDHDIKLSINLSSAQLNLNNLNNHIVVQAKRFGIDSKKVQFEITETLNIEFNTQASEFLNKLIDQGYDIAIDDFGCGYTSLLQLVEFPAKMIKFDKTFMDKALDGDNRNMLKPLVELCHSQELGVTVEGVETEDQARYLRKLGCDFLQGYYFGKPTALPELKAQITQCMQRIDEITPPTPFKRSSLRRVSG